MNSNNVTGTMAMLTFVLLTALSMMLIHDKNQVVQPIVSAFYTFTLCGVIYSVLGFRLFGKIELIRQYWLNCLMLNVTTAFIWIGGFYSLKYIPAELYLFVYLSLLPLVTSFIYRTRLAKSFICVALLSLLVMTYHSPHLLLGVSLAIVVGTSGSIYSIYSKKLQPYFNATEMLGFRFYLTMLITAFVCFKYCDIHLMPIAYYASFLFLSLISILIPLICFQVGIVRLSLERALSFLPISPLLCYLVGLMVGKSHFDVTQLGLMIGLVVVMLL